MGLDTIEFVLWAEKEFEIDFPDQDAASIFTVGEFTSYVHGRLLDIQGTDALGEEAIFQRVKEFLVTNFRLSPDKISSDSHFINDIRLDR